MCFSARSSFVAWGISVAIAVYLYKRDKNYDRWNASFIACFSAIQLFEGILWKGPLAPGHEKSDGDASINCTVTKLILIFLLLQPVSQSYGAYKSSPNSILFVLILIYLLILTGTAAQVGGIGTTFGSNSSDSFRSTIGSNGSLVWHNPYSPDAFLGGPIVGGAYLLGLFVPLLWQGKNAIPLIGVGAATAAYSLWTTQGNGGSFGSRWCYAAVAYSIVCLFT